MGEMENGGDDISDTDKTEAPSSKVLPLPPPLTFLLLDASLISDWIVYSLASMSGTTLRIACSSIASSSPGSLWFTTTAALLENILGTGLISVSLVLERREKRRHDYALQTGLCGSFTTYGAMTTAAVDMFLFGLQPQPSWGGFTNMVFAMLVNITLSHTIGFRLGRTLAKLTLRSRRCNAGFILRRLFNPALISLPLIAGVIITLLWSSSESWSLTSISKQRLFGVLLAPVGSVSRALLSKYLNGRPRCAVAFPGTLIANVLGTFVGSVNGGYIHNNGPYRSVILGVLDIGLGGTLSTVSTYVKEVNVLSEKQKLQGSTNFEVGGNDEGAEEIGEFLRRERWADFPEFYILIMSTATIGASILGYLAGGWRAP
ncbi:hypothetical protein TrRE_jg4944 [Triparma retinervis]|uniref:Uncharacterized protein n=1 Tax=Triparma retinervis TaxID=2557542 RepID=A0A9W6ZYQ5_9STRA|nr:hypothetical protein TrRE_jg4944 [Triparma retinervis]